MVDNYDNLSEPGYTPGVTDQAGGEGAGQYGDEAVLDLIASEGLERKKRSGAFVIIGVVILAGAGLFSMHTLTRVQAEAGGDAGTNKTVDEFLRGISGEADDEHLKAIAVIQGDYTSNQVATDKLGADPFAVGDLAAGPTTAVSTGNCEQDVTNGLKDIKVQAVLLGSRPTAFINGKTVQIGDTLEIRKVEFKITAIGNDSVTVYAECPEVELTFDETIYMKRW